MEKEPEDIIVAETFNEDIFDPLEDVFRKVVEENDCKGFELIHKYYYPLLCKFSFRFVHSKEVARDIVSEVFFRFWKNRKSVKVRISYRAYFFCAVKNRSINHLSREVRRYCPLGKMELQIPSREDNPEEVYIHKEFGRKIMSAIDFLSPQCRMVFKLSKYEGLKNREIALKLNISDKTVEAHITRAIKSLRLSLKNN